MGELMLDVRVRIKFKFTPTTIQTLDSVNRWAMTRRTLETGVSTNAGRRPGRTGALAGMGAGAGFDATGSGAALAEGALAAGWNYNTEDRHNNNNGINRDIQI